MTLRTYRYVNSSLLQDLANQIPSLNKGKGLGVKFAMKTGIADAELTRDGSKEPMPEQQILNHVLEELRTNGQLTIERPYRMADMYFQYADSYVWESRRLATPVRLRVHDDLVEEYGGNYLNLWVIDPLENLELPHKEWETVGTFIYLVEGYVKTESGRPATVRSGISALRAIVDFYAGKHPQYRPHSISEVDVSVPDVYGRDNHEHPLDKLAKAGAHIDQPRLIETVYKPVYMTDEQAAVINGSAIRVNDLLATPLFIAT